MQKHTAFLAIFLITLPLAAQGTVPEWCQPLPPA